MSDNCLAKCGHLSKFRSMSVLFDLAQQSPGVMMQKIRSGLSSESFVEVADRLGVSQETLASKLGLVARTLNRKRRAHENLSAQESERIFRVVRIWNSARALFSSDEAIADWMARPASSLDHAAPLDLLDTDVGTSKVEGLIKGLAYGNFQ